MVSACSENAIRFLSEACFETVVCADNLPKENSRSKSDYFSFPPVYQQQETSYREFLFLIEDMSGEASHFLGKAHDAITSWAAKHVLSYQKETGDSSSQGKYDTNVLTAFSADDSQTIPDVMDDNFTLLSDDSERSLLFSLLRQSQIHQRLAPLLPGEKIRLYEQYEVNHKSPGVWVIWVFQPDEKCQGLHFELHLEGDAFAMTLDETDILDNVRVLVEREAGGTEKLIFQVRTSMREKHLEVAGDMIISHLGVILGMDQASLESLETVDGKCKGNKRSSQLWERGVHRLPLLYSASSNNSESPFVRWTMTQESRRANLMS
jgi:hypothetical protein